MYKRFWVSRRAMRREFAEEAGLYQPHKREIRRAHYHRLKNNRKHYWGRDSIWSDPLDEDQLGIVVNTPAPCSCHMCGNPRKHWKGALKKQEIKSQNNFVDDLQEFADRFYIGRYQKTNQTVGWR